MGLWSIIVNGVETNLDVYGFYIAVPLGAGLPDPQVVTQSYAVLDGAQFQRSRVPPRVLTLQGTLVGSSLADLHAKRKALIAAVRRDNRDPQTPVTLKYTGGPTTPLYIDGYYEAGLSVGERRGFSEAVSLRLLCPGPLFYGASATHVLEVQASFTVTAVGWARRTNRVWSAQNLQAFHAVRASNGDALVATAFQVYRSAPGADIELGNMTSAGNFRCICEGADGSIYVGGSFTAINGVAAANIARYNGSAWSALGTGLSGGLVRSVVASDKLYVGGSFTTAGGAAIPYLAAWNGSAWSAVGTGLNGGVLALAIGPDGTLYVGGSFTTAGGAAIPYLAAWNGSAWSAVGTALSSSPLALAIGLDGSLYAGGTWGVQRWNGSAWVSLGVGVNGLVSALFIDPNGLLYVCGDFTTAGGITTPDRMAIWNGSAWLSLDLDLPAGITTNHMIVEDGWGRIHVGFSGSAGGSATFSSVTTVTNPGSAAASPKVSIFAPAGGRLYQLINTTTGAALYFNLDMLAGETLTVDTERKTVTSSFRGNLLRSMLSGSQLGRWALLPGANTISYYHASAAATATMSWTNRYWSVDG